MIEALIAYIQERGFSVRVREGVLFFWCVVEEEIVGYSWAIAAVELKYGYPETLYMEAEQHMLEVSLEVIKRKAMWREAHLSIGTEKNTRLFQ